MTDTTAPVDREAEIKAQIELADRVLWETRDGRSYHWVRDYTWLQHERASLVRELAALEAEATSFRYIGKHALIDQLMALGAGNQP